MVTSRRLAREAALQTLYSLDSTDEWTSERAREFSKHFLTTGSPLHTAPENPDSAHHRDFSEELVFGIVENLKGLDSTIEHCATHWDIDQMNQVDRNILRIGVYELVFRDDIPPKVSINEAIEISKSYGATDSPNFINGVLDKVAKILRESPEEVKSYFKKDKRKNSAPG